jgi:hypothetical protein
LFFKEVRGNATNMRRPRGPPGSPAMRFLPCSPLAAALATAVAHEGKEICGGKVAGEGDV